MLEIREISQRKPASLIMRMYLKFSCAHRGFDLGEKMLLVRIVLSLRSKALKIESDEKNSFFNEFFASYVFFNCRVRRGE